MLLKDKKTVYQKNRLKKQEIWWSEDEHKMILERLMNQGRRMSRIIAEDDNLR